MKNNPKMKLAHISINECPKPDILLLYHCKKELKNQTFYVCKINLNQANLAVCKCVAH